MVLWVLASMLLAAVISPWLYQGGKALAAVAARQDLGTFLEWLGEACGRAKFGRFFSRSLSFSALLFLPLLFRRIRKMRNVDTALMPGNARLDWKRGLSQLAIGCLIASGVLWALVMLLHATGAYIVHPHPPKPGKFFTAVLVPAVAASLVEEILFRGVLLGLWMKSARPLSACLASSLLFAFLHFLDPPSGFAITDPGAPTAGFQLLGSILFHFAEPRFLVTDFATLFALGMVLAWARVRTGALWFSIGLHAGVVLAFKSSNLLFSEVTLHPLRPWCVGENVRSGLLPMIALGLTALVCHFVLQNFDRRRASSHAAAPFRVSSPRAEDTYQG